MDAAEQRFTNLYGAGYRPILSYFIRRVDSATIAQDLTEDVFLTAWRKLDDVPPDGEALFWLYGVARRALANHRRSTARRLRLAPHLREATLVEFDGPEDHLVQHEEARTIRRVLSTLRVKDQEIIRLAYWDELPHDVIGRLVGCSRSAVDVRLHRAVRRLRKALATSERMPIADMPRTTPEETAC